jgi:PAS domain S-box-containing protein
MESSPEQFEPSAYLAAIVNSSEDAIASKNLSGIVQSWNKAAERMFGYSAREAIGQPMLLIIPTHLHG